MGSGSGSGRACPAPTAAAAVGPKVHTEPYNTFTIGAVDPHTSGEGFDGWRNYHPDETLVAPPPIVPPHTWLLNKGWRRHGLIVLPIYVPSPLCARR